MPNPTGNELGGGLPSMPNLRGVGKRILQLAILLLAIIFLMSSTTSIPTGNVGVLTLFGKVTGETLQEGIHLLNPLKSVQKLSIQTQSLLSLIVGGIAFETPPDGTVRDEAAEDMVFSLYGDRAAAFRPPAHDPQTYQLVFRQSVRGLTAGAPVEFHGMPIGEVVSLDARLDPQTFEFSVPVTVRLDAQRLGMALGDDAAEADVVALRHKLMENLVAHGVRAQLRSGSLLTGAMYVAFDTFPTAAPVSAIADHLAAPASILPRPAHAAGRHVISQIAISS